MGRKRRGRKAGARVRAAAWPSAVFAGALISMAAASPAAVAAPCAVPAADGRGGSDCVNGPLRTSGAASARLELAGGALVASGSVRERQAERVRLVVYRARAGRWVKVSERTASLRDGRFRARVARSDAPRWKVEVIVAQKGGTAPAAGRPAAEARFFETPPPGPLPGGGYVARGAAGAAVKAFQRGLAQAGFRVRRDGRFGRDDAAVLRGFQGAHGLLVDGIVGRQTAAALAVYGDAAGEGQGGERTAAADRPPTGEVTPLAEPEQQGLGTRTRRARRGVNTKIVRRSITARAQTLVVRSTRRPARFQCAVDYSAWKSCRSRWTVTGLRPGIHRFRVRALGRRGVPDTTPASLRARVPAPATGSTTTPPAPTPTGPRPGIDATETRPVGSPLLSDEAAAQLVRRSAFEPRPENATANKTVPTASELAEFHSIKNNNPYVKYVTGQFTGTTDEILQWVALKWGINVEMVRASAVNESYWKQDAHGDIGSGESWGILQVKQSVHLGTYPLSLKATAFNADYWGAMMRYYYDGLATWLNQTCCFSGVRYEAGDIYGAFGAWYTGRWHTEAAERYITSLKRRMAERPWLEPGF